jgi:membrane-bound lytic murein transglycosylase B
MAALRTHLRPRHRRAATRLARRAPIVVLLALVAAGAQLASASPSAAPPTAPAADETVESRALQLAARAPLAPGAAGMPHIAADLVGVDVESDGFARAASEYTAAADALTASQREQRDASRRVGALAVERGRLSAQVAASSAREQAYRVRHDKVVAAIEALVVESIMGNGAGDDLVVLTDPAAANEPARRRVLIAAATESLQAEEQRSRALLDRARDDRREAQALRGTATRAMEGSVDAQQRASEAQAAMHPRVSEARTELESARATAEVVGGDFALVALDTYRRAAAVLAEDQPACAIQWWALAGISRVEGRHGTYGGSALDPLGWATPDIIGIPLNGERNTRVIRDSDDGSFDRDPEYDRAVGPMQFIPSTWRRWAADGDGDGEENPHNLYDATLAAARYLCRASSGLSSDEGLRRAYFSYNHSNAYVDNVLRWARAYEQLALELSERR